MLLTICPFFGCSLRLWLEYFAKLHVCWPKRFGFSTVGLSRWRKSREKYWEEQEIPQRNQTVREREREGEEREKRERYPSEVVRHGTQRKKLLGWGKVEQDLKLCKLWPCQTTRGMGSLVWSLPFLHKHSEGRSSNGCTLLTCHSLLGKLEGAFLWLTQLTEVIKYHEILTWKTFLAYRDAKNGYLVAEICSRYFPVRFTCSLARQDLASLDSDLLSFPLGWYTNARLSERLINASQGGQLATTTKVLQ